MNWFVVAVIIIVVAIVAVLFFNRYYRKASREVALVRTGLGGQKIALDGGCIALPFLHKVSEVNMRTSKLEIERAGSRSVITKDRLRVDVVVEFYIHVEATTAGVATAAQALAGKTFRASELAETLEGKLVDAVLSVAAGYTMENLQDKRASYSSEISEMLAADLAQNGIILESVSLTRLDQTPFNALDENNAFNALGMRRLAEIIATNRKERVAIEAEADIAVHQSQLNATKSKLLLSQEEEESTIVQQQHIETARAKSQADIAEQQAESERRRDSARIGRERELRLSEVLRDRELRLKELESKLTTEAEEIENEVKLTVKRTERSEAEANAQTVHSREVQAKEEVKTNQERAIAEREKEIAIIRASEQSEVDDLRVKSEAETMLSIARAEAQATLDRANSAKDEMIARAEGTAELIKAENSHTPDLIKLKLDQARIEILPEIVEKMMKPAEKIETIRINQISGIGSSAGGGEISSEKSATNQVVDSILNLALQLPAAKKLGAEVGLNIGDGIQGISDAVTDKDADKTSEE